VIAVGKGKVTDDGKVHPLDVKKGDRVLFSKYAGTEVQVEATSTSSFARTTSSGSWSKEDVMAKEIRFDQDARRRSCRASISSRTRCA
jgi:hypothetical protein